MTDVERIAAALPGAAEHPQWPLARKAIADLLELAGSPVEGQAARGGRTGVYSRVCEDKGDAFEVELRSRPEEAVEFLAEYLELVHEQVTRGPWGKYEREELAFHARSRGLRRPWGLLAHFFFEFRQLWALLTTARRIPEDLVEDVSAVLWPIVSRIAYETDRREEIQARENNQGNDGDDPDRPALQLVHAGKD